LTPDIGAFDVQMLLAAEFVTVKLPSPFENATGIELHPLPPARSMSLRPSLLKSPLTTLTFAVAALDVHIEGAAMFVRVKVVLSRNRIRIKGRDSGAWDEVRTGYTDVISARRRG
jgi:hypothetical protein